MTMKCGCIYILECSQIMKQCADLIQYKLFSTIMIIYVPLLLQHYVIIEKGSFKVYVHANTWKHIIWHLSIYLYLYIYIKECSQIRKQCADMIQYRILLHYIYYPSLTQCDHTEKGSFKRYTYMQTNAVEFMQGKFTGWSFCTDVTALLVKQS